MLHARSIVSETGAAPVKLGFALGEFFVSKPDPEKTDIEAVQNWESEGGASIRLHEEAFVESIARLTSIERANENTSRNVD
jgi:hypothetical protein